MSFKRWLRAAAFISFGSFFSVKVQAVDHSKFRTCDQTGFCRRNRKHDFKRGQFEVVPGSLVVGPSKVEGKLKSAELNDIPLLLKVHFYQNGMARVRVTEDSSEARWEAPDIVTEENLVPAPCTSVKNGDPSLPPALAKVTDQQALFFSFGGNKLVALQLAPFGFGLYVDGEIQMAANAHGLMHFEQRKRNEDGALLAESRRLLEQHQEEEEETKEEKEIVDYGEDGLAIYADGSKEVKPNSQSDAHLGHDGDGPETFNGHTDSKPFGPTSVGVDVTFFGYRTIYGLPEHASSMALKSTRGKNPQYTDPYRLYNLDVFEYELDSPMALYGAVPLVLAHKAADSGSVNTVGAFWFNPSETFVDVEHAENDVVTRFISESGVLDLMLLPGPRPADVFHQYADTTGYPSLPPLFSLGYHQCRWNYKDQKDVAQVDAKFEELDFPYDVIWLDIEHTDDKRYFTWNSQLFPNPAQMQQEIAAHGRRMVTIVDPHVKRDTNYYIHKTATELGYYVKNKNGQDFDGWCWPGSSSYLDFTDSKVRSWWSDQFSLSNYKGSTLDLFTWNDMNEPSVFNGPEVSMHKDSKNIAGVEHREWHNLYGIYMHRATAEGLVRRSPGQNERPFVLSRSFFAGTQKTGAIWTGDNKASWDHLQAAAPMLLSLSIGGISFCGADVGGFFGNPDPELLIRWYQAGSFQPFFRAHAHIETKRREPWVFGEPTTSILKKAVMTRYTYLPYWYTLFYEATVSGLPPMRPMWLEFPQDSSVLTMDDQWMVGSNLLVKPVVEAGKTTVDVYLPPDSVWYAENTGERLTGEGTFVKLEAPLDRIPVLQKGGSIIPRKFRLRRSSKMMHYDPYSIIVALDTQEEAAGSVFMDDEHSFDYTKGNMKYTKLTFSGGQLTNSPAPGASTSFDPDNRLERIMIYGIKKRPASVELQDKFGKGTVLYFDHSESAQILVVRKPDCKMSEPWTINFLE